MCREERMTAELEKDLWSRITVVTDRKLAVRPFLDQIEILCQKGPERILLREKDLNLPEYEKLAVEVKEICDRYQVPFYCHTYREAAVKAGTQGLQLPLSVLRETGRGSLDKKWNLGCSVHSLEEAQEAECLGADYVIAGHIFATDCKKGLHPRGLDFLEQICRSVSLPVYAIGGIRLEQDQIKKTLAAGARGVCIMSGAMKFQP